MELLRIQGRRVQGLLALGIALGIVGCELPGKKDSDDSGTPVNTKCSPTSPLGNKVDSLLSSSSGTNALCAVYEGRVKCWSNNNVGQLGVSPKIDFENEPDGKGSCLPYVDLGTGVKASKIVSIGGDFGQCALLTDGTVKCWGLNREGSLGVGDLFERTTTSNSMGDQLERVNLGGNGSPFTVVDISAASLSFCAVLSDGRIKCWGRHSQYGYRYALPGFFGDQLSDMGNNLPFINIPAGRKAVKIASSEARVGVCAVLDDGSLYCANRVCGPCPSATSCGVPFAGSLNDPWFTCVTNTDISAGAGPMIPYGVISVGGTVKDVSMGANFVCALLTNGQVKCWGHNERGQLGQGDTASRATADPTAVASIPPIDLGTGRTAIKLSVGDRYACAVLDNGKIKCWGTNDFGNLGLGDTVARGMSAGQMGDNLPTVDLGTGHTVLDVSAYGGRACAILDDHTVKCWGTNDAFLATAPGTHGGAPGTMGDALPIVQLW